MAAGLVDVVGEQAPTWPGASARAGSLGQVGRGGGRAAGAEGCGAGVRLRARRGECGTGRG